MKGIEGHARIPAPGWLDIQAEAGVSGTTPEVAANKLFRMRAAEIEAELADPLRNGYEPPIWHVCDALLGIGWCYDRHFLKKCRLAFLEDARRQRPDAGQEPTDGEVWEWFCERMRKCLGYDRPVKMLLIMGGNRAAKSEYAAKRCMQMMAEKENARVYAMHMSDPRSVRDQQPLFWKYMPSEWQVQTAGLTAYIKYKKKTGFSENSFITPNGSEAAFLNYMQNKDTALQGMEADLVAPDELIPADWVDDIMLRLATRAGRGILTFTPINGYTPTVKIFGDGATIVRTTTAYLCPRDGGAPDEARALHLSQEEYRELWKAVDGHRAALAAQSKPEDVLAWITEDGRRKTEGRKTERVFDEVPRVMRCVDPRKAVVFFNPSDNPYGNPKEVMADLRKKSKAYVRERFYGQAEKTISVLIPKFNRKIHVVKAKDIPATGTNYFFMDPAKDRNNFMSWFRRKGQDVFLYREWPGNYEIPGVGIPGPWAIPSGKKDGINDGAPGEGQKPAFGFGNLRYKFEIARLERWADWRKHMERGAGSVGREAYPKEEDLALWRDDIPEGADEIITSRFIDSRAASEPRIEKDRPVTLQTAFDDIFLNFYLAPGADIADGVSAINSALDYEETDQTDRTEGPDRRFLNPPHFFVSEECVNSIYALENWMNADGQEGACKDPIDLIRYFFMAECEDVGPNDYAARGGVSYGRQTPAAGGQTRVRRGPRRLPCSAQ
ncbi:MAG: hypothetical protein WC331_11010 [Candidatus Omnitrophota bacterium]